ncbi:MAG: hypothetical protein M3N54_09020 [Acidobacteriota bacterium]|nr:hypothetical protein [Acidobacteriota bacterium]
MVKLTSLLLVAGMLGGADNSWQKVVGLKSGSELRIYKKASSQPVAATFEEANGSVRDGLPAAAGDA